MDDKSSSPAPQAAPAEPEPSYSPSVSEEEMVPDPPPRLRRRNETADVDAVAMLLGLSQYEDDGTSNAGNAATAPSRNNAPSNRPKRPLSSTHAATAGTAPKNTNVTRKGAARMGPGDNRVRPPKAATKLLPEAKWRHIRLPDVQSALEAEDIVVLWGHYKYPEALPRKKAEGHLNFVWRHYKDSQLKTLLEPIQTAFELENFLKDRYGVGTSTKRPRTGTTTAAPSTTTSGNPIPPLLPPAQATAAVINSLPPMIGRGPPSAAAVAVAVAEKSTKPLSRQASGYEQQQQQQQRQQQLTSSPDALSPNTGNGNGNTTATNNNTESGRVLPRQSSKEMAGLLYIGAGLTDDQEVDTSEGSGNEGEENGSDKPSSSPEVKKEEGEEEKAAAGAGVGGGLVGQQQQQEQQQQQMDPSFAAALAAAININTGASPGAGNNNNNNSDAPTTTTTTAAGAAAGASSMMDPTTASFLAAAAANGLPNLSFPGMMHPAWGNLLANPLAWQLAGAGAGGPIPPPPPGGVTNGTTAINTNNAGVNNTTNAINNAPTANNQGRGNGSNSNNNEIGNIQSQMAAMFPGLQFPGAFDQLAALGGFQNLPSLHPSTAAAAAAAAGIAGIDPLSFLPPPGTAPPGPTGAGVATNTTAPRREGNITTPNSNNNNDGAAGKYNNNTGDRPGRPPSYDIMVRWCVNLKRCLWQRHVPLTIEEAVTMVNDPTLCARPPTLTEKTRVLVASTLRKRVLGIYKITWSQVATDADPGLHDEVTDPSVHAAAGIKLKRHGVEPGRPTRGPVVTGAGGGASLVINNASAGAGNSGSGVLPGMMLPPGLLGNNNTSADDLSAFTMASAAAAAIAPSAAGKKEDELLGANGTAHSSRDLSEAANAAREAAIAAASATHLEPGAGNLPPPLPPSLPPMSSSLEDMRNAMGLEIEVKELSPGATAAVPSSTVKEMLNLIQKQQQQQQQQVHVATAAAPQTAATALAPAPPPPPALAVDFDALDLPSLASLERAMDTVDGVDGLNNPEGPAPGTAAVANGGGAGDGQNVQKISSAKDAFRTKFAIVDTTDSDGMFGAMCDLHHVAGVSKQECAAICRLWLENVLDENQKKQLFMYIKANIKEEDLVADWVKSFIRKHGG